MARRPSSPSPRPRARVPRPQAKAARPRVRTIAALAAVVFVAFLGSAAWWRSTTLSRTLARAEAASRAGDHVTALEAWRAVNATSQARSASLLAEAHAALALGRAGEADGALARAAEADPTNSEPWRYRLERFRVLDLPLAALDVGWAAYAAVPSTARRGVLRDLTLALIADLPEDLARPTLARWADANPNLPDLDARVALLRRFSSMPREGDPDRATRIAELTALLASHPEHVAAREALVSDLADAGEPERGRALLDAWPKPLRDARYERLRGRWEIDYDHQPSLAVSAFQAAIESLPHDWKTRVRLSRSLHSLGRQPEARQEAETVSRIRETLDPVKLGPRLAADLDRLDAPKSLLDLADLCARAGLARLSEAWRREAVSAR